MKQISARLLGALLAFALPINDATAQQVVTTCGGSSGYGYYLEPSGTGWTKDGIHSGSLSILRDAAGAYDVLIKDTQTSFSAKGDGAKVFKVDGNDDERSHLSWCIHYP